MEIGTIRIPKIEGLAPGDRKAVEAAFEALVPQPVACCNWSAEFPYAPQVTFRMFHTGAYLMVRFDVAERYTMACVAQDNGASWTDSCVELFISPEPGVYYNFETTCAGRLLLACHTSRHEGVKAPAEALESVIRHTSLPFGETFPEREGDNRWSLTLAIPPRALFRHRIDDWSGHSVRMNLYKCGDNLSHPHFLSWRPIPTEKPDFHRPEYFGEAVFDR